MKQAGVGILVGIGSIQPVDIRQQDQEICLHADGHNGAQCVVVTHPNFIGDHGVVFIDNGYGGKLQQAADGVLKILIPLRIFHIRAIEQNLSHGVVVFREQLVIGVHQFALAHGGCSLLGGNIPGLSGQQQLANAHGDGTGGHHENFMAHIFQIGQGFAQTLDPPDVQTAGGMGQGRCTKLDHNAHRRRPPFPPEVRGLLPRIVPQSGGGSKKMAFRFC